ncbi:MAG: glycosyltransferase family 39 protein, partial [Treponema sp.]|nr:glycosyltransferase family 39 protein [Treponema sp.]
MKKAIIYLLSITCFLAGIVSFFYLTMRHRDLIGEYYAKSSVNVEIDKQYAKNIALAVETSPNPCAYWMSPTTAGDAGTQNIVMHISVPLKRPYWNPAIQIPREYAEDALTRIDHTAMFVGNKVFYFSHEDVQKFTREDKDGYARFYLPGVFYERSLVFRNWANYYGDLNLGIKTLTAFFLYPARYVFPWFFLLLLLLLNKKNLGNFYASVRRNKETAARIMLGLIIAVAFILRWNGYVRHSGWTDEIYSAVRTGNPHLPFISTFGDPGNPPFYFILLRYWFKLSGWTENSGTMLSVLLGTGAVFTLYALVKPFMGKKTALRAALFTALSGFAIGYSQEMRAYILKMFLAPLVSLAFLNLLKNMPVKNIILYLLPSVCMVNSHYYGILFIMANYLFFVLFMVYRHAWDWKKFIVFTLVNGVLALSFLPFFLYMVLHQHYNFVREFTPSIGHGFLMGVLVVFAISFFAFRKTIMDKIEDEGILKKGQLLFTAYLVLVPAFVFALSYGISFFRPMITFRYLWPISAPFFFALAAVFIYCVHSW